MLTFCPDNLGKLLTHAQLKPHVAFTQMVNFHHFEVPFFPQSSMSKTNNLTVLFPSRKFFIIWLKWIISLWLRLRRVSVFTRVSHTLCIFDRFTTSWFMAFCSTKLSFINISLSLPSFGRQCGRGCGLWEAGFICLNCDHPSRVTLCVYSSWFHVSLKRCMHSTQGQIYSKVFLFCIGALNGYIAYFAPLPKRTWIVWGSCRNPPQQDPVGGSRPRCFVCCHCTPLKNLYLWNYNWG